MDATATDIAKPERCIVQCTVCGLHHLLALNMVKQRMRDASLAKEWWRMALEGQQLFVCQKCNTQRKVKRSA